MPPTGIKGNARRENRRQRFQHRRREHFRREQLQCIRTGSDGGEALGRRHNAGNTGDSGLFRSANHLNIRMRHHH
jgi:hypothetical protein